MLGLTGFLGLTQISQIPRCCFVGGKSHRLALWVGLCGLLPWGCLGLALTDLFFGPFRPFRPIGQIGRIGHFKKIIREICGICVRPPWDWDLCEASVDSVGAGDKITKNCVIWGVF